MNNNGTSNGHSNHPEDGLWGKCKRVLLGSPRNVTDPAIFHKVSLIALLAWVGLGADGLSSSAYGPEEAFRALGQHTYLAVGLALATALTVFIISYSYSRIIEHFPYGGGGYIVTSRLLTPQVGVVSGSALVIDYMLTISVSVASGVDQIFSVFPPGWAEYKLFVQALAIAFLVLLNLRGVKESVKIMTPVFAVFLLTHAVLLVFGIGSHLNALPRVAGEVHTGFQSGLQTLGFVGMMSLFMKAYAMGGGTYTGIEAVSNGLQIMREPKVQTARKTMLYMSISLAVTASGILLCYLLFQVSPEHGKTMNAVLLQRFAGGWTPGGIPLGHLFVILTLAAEAGLLFVAAQAGFLDGPRIMSNMAHDSWMPHGFSQLSDRLTMKNGILLMGIASMLMLFYTGGNITALVTMYSINVFLTFSLTQLAMCRFWLHKQKRRVKGWIRPLLLHLSGFVLCTSILVVVIIEKFSHGAWMTLVVTTSLVLLCFWIHRHYSLVRKGLIRLETALEGIPAEPVAKPIALQPEEPTAVVLVGRYGGLGIHGMLSIQKLFPNHFKNFVFVSIGVVDAASMKGPEEVERIRRLTTEGLQRYVHLANQLGLAAEYRMTMGTEVLEEAENVCLEIAQKYPSAMFFANKLIFEEEKWYQRLLHNETAYQIQRRLQFAGLDCMVMPVRVFADNKEVTAEAIPG